MCLFDISILFDCGSVLGFKEGLVVWASTLYLQSSLPCHGSINASSTPLGPADKLKSISVCQTAVLILSEQLATSDYYRIWIYVAQTEAHDLMQSIL